MCALGEDISDFEVDYWVNGTRCKVNTAFSLRRTFSNFYYRIFHPHVALFPGLANTFIFPYERDLIANAEALRNVVRSMIDRRKKQSANGVKGSDLLSILLADPLFSNNDELMVDELLTIFFAGS